MLPPLGDIPGSFSRNKVWNRIIAEISAVQFRNMFLMTFHVSEIQSSGFVQAFWTGSGRLFREAFRSGFAAGPLPFREFF